MFCIMPRKRADIITMKTVGSRLKQLREEVGLGVGNFAYLTGTHYVVYERYEGGKVEPGYTFLARASNVLGTSLDYLFGRVDETPEIRSERRHQHTEDLWQHYCSGFEASAQLPLDYGRKRRVLGALGLLRGQKDILEKLRKDEKVDFRIKKEVLDALGLWKQ